VGQDDQGAFLYSNGAMIDLNSLLLPGSGWTLSSATAINDSGQIVGYGINPSGQQHAFLLDGAAAAAAPAAAPEPSSLALFGAAGAFLALRRRKLQRS
jgi:probable HAF family extracellular repeat protein